MMGSHGSGLGALVGLAVLTAAQAAAAEWPERPVTVVVPWAAGGGTDATGRILAQMLEKEHGVPFNVVNRTDGGGIVGHSAIATAAPDGYTIGVVTAEISTYACMGISDLTEDSARCDRGGARRHLQALRHARGGGLPPRVRRPAQGARDRSQGG
jgi:tripartite-type tricarboxylate transporter receptor subunit TctC